MVTADVIQSRAKGYAVASLPERLSELQHPQLVAGFAMSRGDEIQGVLATFSICRQIHHPLQENL